jgi:nucleotide-binding universal stress UspA family protein
MIERILLCVDDTPGLGRTAAWALDLARALSCRLFAVAVIARPDAEERAWELLYEIEDDAFEQNVRVSLLLESGEALPQLARLAASYGVDLVVAGADTRLPAGELVDQSPRPVVFVK